MTTLDLVRGGSADVVHTDGNFVTVLSTLPSPPGSPLEGRLGEWTLCIKVKSCKREGERFRIEGRWVNLSRVQRERLTGE